MYFLTAPYFAPYTFHYENIPAYQIAQRVCYKIFLKRVKQSNFSIGDFFYLDLLIFYFLSFILFIFFFFSHSLINGI